MIATVGHRAIAEKGPHGSPLFVGPCLLGPLAHHLGTSRACDTGANDLSCWLSAGASSEKKCAEGRLNDQALFVPHDILKSRRGPASGGDLPWPWFLRRQHGNGLMERSFMASS